MRCEHIYYSGPVLIDYGSNLIPTKKMQQNDDSN